MSEPTPLAKKIHLIRTQMNHYEQEVKQDFDHLKDYLDPKYLWDQTKHFAQTQLTKPSVLLTIGGVVVGIWLISSLFGDDNETKAVKRAAAKGVHTNGKVVLREQPSFLGSLVRAAMQTFILHYARKLLLKYLEGNEAGTNGDTTMASASAAAQNSFA